MSRVLLMVGTRKGAFFLWSDESREDWRLEGPHFKGWDVGPIQMDRRSDPAIWAGVSHFVYGAHLQVSRDLGETWKQIEHGPRYEESSGHKLNRIWCIEPGPPEEPDLLYVGVDEAGLFVSADQGEHWRGVDALNDHPTRGEWSPGLGGLCLHRILIDPLNSNRMWVAISAVGVFRSDDRGASWQACNKGAPIVAKGKEFEHIGSCVHSLVQAGNVPDLLYQQNHQGVFRSLDGADSWQRIENGLPATFGFPMELDPNDSNTLYTIPLESDEYRLPIEGRLAVFRSRDAGDSWYAMTTGLPQSGFYSGVLRHSLAVDGLGPCGIYFGTTGGQVFYSRDGGEDWQLMPFVLPRIQSVSAFLLD